MIADAAERSRTDLHKVLVIDDQAESGKRYGCY